MGASDAELNWKHQFCFWLHPFIACELKVLSENSNTYEIVSELMVLLVCHKILSRVSFQSTETELVVMLVEFSREMVLMELLVRWWRWLRLWGRCNNGSEDGGIIGG